MHIGGCQEMLGGENKEHLLNGYEVFFWSDENVLELYRGNATKLFLLNRLISCYVNFTC